MFGRKKRSKFDEFATAAVVQAMTSLEAKGMKSEFVGVNDEQLSGYRGHNVDWRRVWENAAERNRRTPDLLDSVFQNSATGSNTTTVPPYGASPYWKPAPSEKGGCAPTSVLAFLSYGRRASIANDKGAPGAVLEMLSQDDQRMIRTAAGITLLSRRRGE